MKKITRYIRSTVAFLLLVLLHTQIIFAADLQVDTTTDAGAAGCELREAVTSVNSAADSGGCLHSGDGYGVFDKITFTGAGVGTHTLNGNEISITAPVTIEGPAHLGTPAVTVDAGGASRIFDVNNPDGTTVTIRNLELTNGAATNGGLAFLHNGSVGTPKTLVLDKNDLRNGTASGNGGAIHTGQNNAVTINGSELDNNSADSGGAVYVDSGTTLSTDKSDYHDNTAANNGGAIDLQTGSAASTIDRARLQKNSTTLGDGGAVHISSGSLTLKRSTIGETIIGDGNGNSAASEGGGVAVDGTASLNLDTDNFATNTSAFAGGGVNFTSTGTLFIDNTNFLGNTSTGGSGGGVHVSSASSVNLSTVTFGGANPGESNTAGVGGGLWVENVDAQLSEVDFINNAANADGGGLYFSNSTPSKTTLTYNTGAVSTNSANGNGGALFLDNNIIADLSFLDIDSNTALNQAGALFIESGTSSLDNAEITVSDSSFTNNSADIPLDFGGGAIHLGHWGDLTLDNITASGNLATAGGGGFLNAFSNVLISVIDPASSITDNHAQAGHGGAFRIQSGTLSLEGNISNNSATDGGGAIYGAGDLSLSGLTVTSVSDATFYSNTTTGLRTNGGAINLAIGFINMANSTFGELLNGNTAPSGNGGAIYTQEADIILDNPKMIANSAENGGAIYMDPQSATRNLTMTSGGTININSATSGNGGAISLSGTAGVGTATLAGVGFSTNTASINGGAISTDLFNNLEFNNCTLDNNTADQNGGAMYLVGGNVSLLNSTFSGNSATNGDGGAVRAVTTDFDEATSTFTSNFADSGNGGALSLDISGPVSIAGTADISNVFTLNHALLKGGAIYSSSADMSIDYSFFQNNSADEDGGAVALNPNAGIGTSVLHNNIVDYDQNTAGDDGGAIYCDNTGGTAVCEIYYTGASLAHGFTSNSAVDAGGAIANEVSSFGVNNLLDITNAVFSNNTADRGAAIAMNLGSAILHGVNLINNTATLQNIVELGHDQIDDVDVDFQFSNLLVDNNTAPSGTGLRLLDWGEQAAASLIDSTFSNNHGQGAFGAEQMLSGPGITTTINNVTFDSNNDTTGSLPGVVYNDNGNLDIVGSTFSNNSGIPGLYSAVIASGARMYLNKNAIVNNSIGAIYSTELIDFFTSPNLFTNNTFSGNTFDDATLMAIDGDTDFVNNTIYRNTEIPGGTGAPGLMNLIFSDFHFANNIIGGNFIGPETPSATCVHSGLGGAFSLGHNMIEEATSCIALDGSDITGSTPPLSVLSLNGGATLNHIITGNSPALDGGNDTLADLFDQRGLIRPVGLISDIGSTDVADTFTPDLLLITPVAPINPGATPLTFEFSSDENVFFFGATGCPGAIVSLSPTSPYTVTINGLAPGDYTCDFSFADASGNSGTLPSQAFTVTAPIIPPASGGGGGGSAQFGQPPSQGGQPQSPATPGQQPTTPSQPAQPTQPTTPPVSNPTVSTPVISVPTTTPAKPASSVTSTQPLVSPATTTPIETPVDNTHQSAFTPGTITPPFSFGNICKFDQFANQYNLPSIDSSTDFDGDGLSDKLECLVKTNPRKADTDDDKYNDGREVLNLFTNPLIPNRGIRGGIEIITPEDQLKSADETPYVLGLAPANKKAQVYLFEKADFDEIAEQIIREIEEQEDLNPEQKTLLYHQKLTDAIQKILAKFLSNSLDPKNPLEAKFINHVGDLGSTDVSENGLFVLDSEKAIKDGNYLLMAVSGSLFSTEKELTIDQTLKVITPTLKKFDNKPIPAEALLGDLRIEVTPGTQTPVLVGNIKESSRIVATWQSNIVSSALLADSLDEEFRLSSPSPLALGDHKVYITAYRQSDGAQSETLSLNFKLQAATPAADYSRYIYLGLAALLLIILWALVRRRHNKSKDLSPIAGPITVSTTAEPTTSSSNATFTAMASTPNQSTITPAQNAVKTEVVQPASSTPDMLSEIFGEDEAKKFDEKQK